MPVSHHSGGDKRKHVRSRKRSVPRGRLNKLEAQVKELRSDTNVGISELTARERHTSHIVVTKGSAGADKQSADYQAFSRDSMARALAKITMWDEATEDWVRSDPSKLGGDSIEVAYRSSELTVKNFQPNDCNVTVWLLQSKGAVDLEPLDAWRNGAIDTHIPGLSRIGLNSGYEQNVQSFPSDSALFRSSYTMVATHVEKLNPGETLKWKTPSHLNKGFKYNHQQQLEGDDNLVMKGSLYWLVSLDGGIMQDSTLGYIQNGTAQIGIAVNNTIKVKYNSGGPSRKSVAFTPAATAANGGDGGAIFVNAPRGITHGGNEHRTNNVI